LLPPSRSGTRGRDQQKRGTKSGCGKESPLSSGSFGWILALAGSHLGLLWLRNFMVLLLVIAQKIALHMADSAIFNDPRFGRYFCSGTLLMDANLGVAR